MRCVTSNRHDLSCTSIVERNHLRIIIRMHNDIQGFNLRPAHSHHLVTRQVGFISILLPVVSDYGEMLVKPLDGLLAVIYKAYLFQNWHLPYIFDLITTFGSGLPWPGNGKARVVVVNQQFLSTKDNWCHVLYSSSKELIDRTVPKSSVSSLFHQSVPLCDNSVHLPSMTSSMSTRFSNPKLPRLSLRRKLSLDSVSSS
jgi:hypothetical protein